MVRPGRERLSGPVEVDETIVGGVEEGGGRRHLGKKALVAIAAEVRGTAIGRVRMRRIPNSGGPSLISFVRNAVERLVLGGGLGIGLAHFVVERGQNPVVDQAAQTTDYGCEELASLRGSYSRVLIGCCTGGLHSDAHHLWGKLFHADRAHLLLQPV